MVAMLWNNTSDRSIRAAVQQLQSQAYAKLKADAEEYDTFRFASGVTKLTKPPGQPQVLFERQRHMTIDVLEFLLQAMCQTYVYEGGPKRVWEFPTPESKRIWTTFEGRSDEWEDATDLFGERDTFTELCSYLEQEVEFHGTVLCKLHPTDTAPVVIPFVPHQYDVILNNENPRRIDVVRLRMNDKRDLVTTFQQQKDYREIYEVWTREWFARVDENGQFLADVDKHGKPIKYPVNNPYKVIPLVVLRRVPSFKQFFCPGLAERLVDFCKSLNDLTDSIYRISKHGHGQIILTGQWDKKPRFVGPDSVWEAGRGDAHTLNLATSLSDLCKTWVELLQNQAMALGISPGLVLKELYLTGGDRSGASFEIARRGPLDGQIQKQGRWKTNERRIVNMGALVQATKTKASIEAIRPKSLTISFPDTRRTPADLREDDRFELENAIKEVWQVALRRDPTLTETRAKEQVLNAQKSKAFASQRSVPVPAAPSVV